MIPTRYITILLLALLLTAPVWAATDFSALTLREPCSPDEAPLGSTTGNWTTDIVSTDTSTVIADGGTCTRDLSGQPGSAWWDVATFGPNTAIAATCPDCTHTATASFRLWLRLVNPGVGSSTDGYACSFEPFTDGTELYRMDNSVETVIQSCALSGNLTDGDSVACEMIGSTLKAYVNYSGTWVEECSDVDTTYTSVGSVGLTLRSPNIAIDNIRFDTVIPAAVGQALWPLLQ